MRSDWKELETVSGENLPAKDWGIKILFQTQLQALIQLSTLNVENDLQKSYENTSDVEYSSTFPKRHHVLKVIFAESKVEVL